MADEELHHPHDSLFKRGFAHPSDVASFLSQQLPAATAAKIDWASLSPEPGSFIDSAFRKSQTDLLFRARFRGKDEPVFVYLLFEHLHQPDRWFPVILPRYITRIYELALQAKPTPHHLPPVLPIVLLQNPAPTGFAGSFEDLFAAECRDDSALHPFLTRFDLVLIELAKLDLHAGDYTPKSRIVLRVLKAETQQRLMEAEVWEESLLIQLETEFLEFILRYILGVSDVDYEALQFRLDQLHDSTLKSKTMTLADQLQQMGRQEGRQEGQLHSLRESVVNCLEARFLLIPPSIHEEIWRVDHLEKLRSLLRHAATCRDLEDFATQL